VFQLERSQAMADPRVKLAKEPRSVRQIEVLFPSEQVAPQRYAEESFLRTVAELNSPQIAARIAAEREAGYRVAATP
jgi:hypothetical protein